MSNRQATGGIGITTAFVLLFVGLKLTDSIDWNWFWVFSPWLLPVGIGVALITVVAAGVLAWFVTKDVVLWRRRKKKFDQAYEVMREAQRLNEEE